MTWIQSEVWFYTAQRGPSKILGQKRCQEPTGEKNCSGHCHNNYRPREQMIFSISDLSSLILWMNIKRWSASIQGFLSGFWHWYLWSFLPFNRMFEWRDRYVCLGRTLNFSHTVLEPFTIKAVWELEKNDTSSFSVERFKSSPLIPIPGN